MKHQSFHFNIFFKTEHGKVCFSCNHSNSDVFMPEDNMLSSCVKISCFEHMQARLVFHQYLC